MNLRFFYKIICFCFILLISSCHPYKNAQKLILNGQYDKAIEYLSKKYKNGVKEKHKDGLVNTLKQAYSKANTQDLDHIKHLESSYNTVQKAKEIYHSYERIYLRQEKLKPLLPIKMLGKEMVFDLTDYSKKLNKSKWLYALALNKNGLQLMQKNTINTYREAYYNFIEVKKLYPNFSKIDDNLHESRHQGTTYAFMVIKNTSDTYISNSEYSLLNNLNIIGRNTEWVEVHSSLNSNINYAYDIIYDYQHIDFSKEKETHQIFIKEKEIIEKYEFVLDENNEIVTDSLGVKQTEPKYKLLRCEIDELHRFKKVDVQVKVTVFNNILDQKSNKYFDNEIVFEDFKSTIAGDESAIDDEYLKTMSKHISRFPSDEEMLEDCLNDITKYTKRYIFSLVK